jgi:hypothetical protein
MEHGYRLNPVWSHGAGPENAESENAGPENDGSNWIFVNLSISGNSTCVFEVGHQISKESVERFKSYRDLKKSKMAAGLRLAITDFIKFEHFGVIVLVGPKLATKFQKNRSSGSKVIEFEEIQDGRRPTAPILDFGTARRCAARRCARWY